MRVETDVAILGAGFGGSLMALLLRRLGRRVALVDRSRHPRFAIGESSTPIADLVLRDLADRYDLPALRPLSAWGPWKRTYPELGCGIKRGFSYFRHVADEPFEPTPDHRHELLVTASPSDEKSDTHWLRADVDAFLARQAEQEGALLFEETEIAELSHPGGWRLEARQGNRPLIVDARFVIDASGPGSALARALGLVDRSRDLLTQSRALYSHFSGVERFEQLLAEAGGSTAEHPFPCDHAAQHHLLDGAWMWNLRFDDGLTSVGLVLDLRRHPAEPAEPPHREWTAWLRRYPSLERQLAVAEPVEPPGRLLRTGRLQRLAERFVGEDWALLPHSAVFIDPLHSTGIGHTICGVERLARALEEHWRRPSLERELAAYETTLRRELRLVDLLVDGGYRTLDDFRRFVAYSMLYFAAAITYEHRRAEADPASPFSGAFLCADDPHLVALVEELHRQLPEPGSRSPLGDDAAAAFEEEVRRGIEPYNEWGLCDPGAQNLYAYTVAPK